MEAKKILIAGKFISCTDNFEVTAPYRGDTIASVFAADRNHAEIAINKAAECSVEMRNMPRYLLRNGLELISKGILNRKDEFARTIARESAKPLLQARIEVERAIATFRIAASEAERFAGEIVPVDLNPGAEGRTATTSFTPRGVIFGITPFNYPLNLVAHKVAPALASGNSIIIKPSEKTPLTSLLLGEVFLESGLPRCSLQIVPMELDVLSEVLHDERIRMISFTGSDRVGWSLRQRYSRKAFALELGGNAPVIVDETADLEDAANRVAIGAFAYSGQICISVQRVIVQETIEPEFTSLLKEKALALKAGDPLDEKTEISSMISKQAAESAIEIVSEAVQNGAEIACGGQSEGNFVEPTLVRNVDPEMRIVRDEIFAPVATIELFGSFREAVVLANDSRFGLQAGVFTNLLNRARFAARNLEYGGVMVNDVPTFRVDNMPYGGMKDSGIGREGVRYAMEEMCERKLVVVRDSQASI